MQTLLPNRKEDSTQGVYKSSITNFQEISRTHLTKFQGDFFIDRAS